MPNFLVNKNPQPKGEHEVHKDDCNNLPEPQNRQKLGWFTSCHGAVDEARKYYDNVDGCKHCCPACHTR